MGPRMKPNQEHMGQSRAEEAAPRRGEDSAGVYPRNIPLEPTQPPPIKGGAHPLKQEHHTQATHLSKREEAPQALASS
jgi:hypothetical protein